MMENFPGDRIALFLSDSLNNYCSILLFHSMLRLKRHSNTEPGKAVKPAITRKGFPVSHLAFN